MEIDNSNPEIIYYQLDLPFGQGQVMFINDAVIDDIRRDRGNTFITISYDQRVRPGSGRNRRQQLVLVTSRVTRVQDNSGRNVDINQLRRGMRINALVSSRMTFSQPPQAQVFIIIINSRRRQNEVVEGRISNINFRRDSFTVREEDRGRDRDRDRDRDRGRDRDRDDDDGRNQVRLFVDDNTTILNRNGREMPFTSLRERDRVRVEYQRLQESARDRVNIAITVQLL